MKPFLTQQALFRATENTYIHSKHKHLPTLHWKYLKKFYVKRKLYFSFKENNHVSVAWKNKYWGWGNIFLTPSPLRFEGLFCLDIFTKIIKKRTKSCFSRLTKEIFRSCFQYFIGEGGGQCSLNSPPLRFEGLFCRLKKKLYFSFKEKNRVSFA